jgi:hypothetical protein
MVTLEKLKQQREKEAKKLLMMQEKSKLIREKKKVQSDIRKIQGASFRARFGTTKKDVEHIGSSFGKAFKGTGKSLLKIGKGLGMGALALGDAANEMYGAKPPKKKKRRFI